MAADFLATRVESLWECQLPGGHLGGFPAPEPPAGASDENGADVAGAESLRRSGCSSSASPMPGVEAGSLSRLFLAVTHYIWPQRENENCKKRGRWTSRQSGPKNGGDDASRCTCICNGQFKNWLQARSGTVVDRCPELSSIIRGALWRYHRWLSTNACAQSADASRRGSSATENGAPKVVSCAFLGHAVARALRGLAQFVGDLGGGRQSHATRPRRLAHDLLYGDVHPPQGHIRHMVACPAKPTRLHLPHPLPIVADDTDDSILYSVLPMAEAKANTRSTMSEYCWYN